MKNANNARLNDMTKGSVLPQIVLFAIPLFIGNLFQQLYNTADCFVVGHFSWKKRPGRNWFYESYYNDCNQFF